MLGVLYEGDRFILKRLDQVLVTRKEVDSVIVWNERLYPSQRKNLKKLKPKNERKLPEADKEDDEKKPLG